MYKKGYLMSQTPKIITPTPSRRDNVIFPSANKVENIKETIKPTEITEVMAYCELFKA